MRVGSEEQHRLFDQLVIVAGGDAEMVRKAIREASPDGETAALSDVLAVIKRAKNLST